MDRLLDVLIDFQIALVSSLAHLTVIGVTLAGVGVLVSSASPVFGYRIKRLGLQVVGACLVVICTHAILLEIYGASVPIGLLVVIYALFSLLLLQGLLNLLFGPSVGNSVVASLISSLILWLLYVVVQPFRYIRDLLR
ncbi:hypothetical protein KBY31_21710 [Ruegeria pomeroyi]|nr:hypothetical protein [Ruegeria pomeroyi]